jgi:hypothetical protein
MSQPYRVILALAAALAAAGCTAATTTAKGTAPAAKVASSASGIPGCAQATAAVTAARQRINAQDYPGAVTLISDLRDTSRGKIAIDAALAAVKLSFLSADAVTPGSAVYQDVKDAQAALAKISADCGA